MKLWSDCKPNPRFKESIGAETQGRLDGEFGGGGSEQTGPRRFAGVERGAQRRFGFGQAFAATGANSKLSTQIAQTIGAAFDGVADLSV